MAHVLSPLPGTFYMKPSPDAALYKTPGDPVAIGDIIGLIEVMKTFIEVKAEFTGTFSAYMAEDGLPVMPGQALAEVAV
ncbi:acetyl-CoA carboxylase biotin carboxyl carrier protein subunit (plasmid) [Aestuarium zhoushanense]|nr:acetyl-CoA carboxylase biotin carboxyl carrier protein subunit [Aestuarium zhoushanense]